METFRKVLPQGLRAPQRGHDSGSFLSGRTCLAQTLVLLSPAQFDGSQTKQKGPGVRQDDRTSSWDTGEDPPTGHSKHQEKVEELQHLGVVDNEGGPQSVLEGTPVSRHTAADGTGQMPLAEEVTCVGKAGAGACCGHCREAETHRGAEVRAGGGDHGGRPGWRRLRRGTWPQSRRHISGFRCAGTGFWRGRGSSGDRSGRDDQPAGAAVGRGRRAAAAPHPASQT